jgi:glyceraldehyde-3-phosphate dehydrogenase (NADP+)
MESGVSITPLPEPDKTTYLKSLVDSATSKGARLINEGGANIHDALFTPALLYPVTPEMDIYNIEQFGPVVPVTSFSDIDEPLEYIKNSNYGQQVSIFGNCPEDVSKLVDQLVNQVCRVNINSQCQRGPDVFPFTGRKDSAEGTLSVSDALRVFTIRTLVATKGTNENKELLGKVLENRMSNFLNTDFIL